MESAPPGRGWERGRGWGWVWGDGDEVGALNWMTPQSRLAALATVRTGAVYDLGVTIDRASYLWPGHAHTELISFRSAAGIRSAGDLAPLGSDPDGISFQTSMVILSDHAGTQIDALCHATLGRDDHWYNGFRAEDASGDFGPRRAGAEQVPPIIAPGVLLDVAGHLEVAELPPHHAISAALLAETAAAQGTAIEPGDVVLVRTGALRNWGADGHDHEAIAGPDSSGLTLEAARWLCADMGAMLVGTDTSTVEVMPPVDGAGGSPVHSYLLVEQGVHMGELHYLEQLAAERAYRFCYLALLPKVRGATAGFAMRPIALT